MSSAVSDRFRGDIQALRGLAILLVLFYHAGIGHIPASGFLGVDMFFVVSGFLITSIIRRSVEAGKFSFTAFYYRRAKRLLPAAFVTLLATAAAAPLILTQQELHDFANQLIGAVTFTGNIVLWRQTGYFEGAADLKPLLHVWSLSVEEQYYLLLPAALVFVPRRYWVLGAWLILAASLALYLAYGRVDPNAAFYLLPTRAWELGLGSLAVLSLEESRIGDVLRIFFWPALLTLLVVPFLPVGGLAYGLDAVVVCVCTLIVILRGHPTVEGSVPVQGLAWIGDMSYSLYLVHWPLFAFAASSWTSPIPNSWRILLTAAALILGYALYIFVERPIRQTTIPLGFKSLGVFAGLSVGVVAVGLLIGYRERTADTISFGTLQRANVGFSKVCDFKEQFFATDACRTSVHPEIMIWGDSHAMHLVAGVTATTERTVIQATRSACGPFLGLSYTSPSGSHNRRWAESCIQFNDSVLEYLASTGSVKVVILASLSDQYLLGSRVVKRMTTDAAGPAGTWREQEGSMELAAGSLAETVSAIRLLGKRVVFVTSMPMSGFDVGRCLELKRSSKPRFGADAADCSIDEQHYRDTRAGALQLWKDIAMRSNLPLIRLDDAVCRHGLCQTELGGVMLYRDKAHLTYDGSRRLAETLHLGTRAWDEAN